MKPLLPALLACSVALAPAVGAAACLQQSGVYTDAQSGYEIRFRPGKSWEMGGMTSHVFELHFPSGEPVLWGRIAGNMGTSRDTGSVFAGCARPGPDDGAMSEDEIEACRIWTGVVYTLGERSATAVPFADAPAAEVLLFTDIGRRLRYSGLVDGPGDEPDDVFTLNGCAP